MHTQKILVVDDDKLIRWSITEMFTQEGLTVDTADSENEALSKAGKSDYSLILADLEVGTGGGAAFLQKLVDLQPRAKLVVISALPRTQVESQIAHLRGICILEKPFTSEQIRAVALEALDLK